VDLGLAPPFKYELYIAPYDRQPANFFPARKLKMESSVFSPPWYVRLRAGSTSGFLGGIGGQIHKISQALTHPGFNKSTTDYDVALLQVTPPFTYSNKVGPIALPDPGKEMRPGQIGTVSGWGMKSVSQ